MEGLKKLLTWCNHNHWYVIGTIILASLSVWLVGCKSTVNSLLTPEKLVTRGELQAEIEYLINLAETRKDELNRQDEIKTQLLNIASVVSVDGSFNPSGLISILTTIASLSFGLDRNYKLKSKVIATQSTNTKDANQTNSGASTG
jgi:hypothetical protein